MTETVHIPLPQLTTKNYRTWKISITAFADEHELEQFITGKPTVPTEPTQLKAHKKKRGQAVRLLISTISQDFMNSIGIDFLEKEPFEMMTTIQGYFDQEQSPIAHENLRNRAELLQIKVKETIEEYFTRHQQLRNDMKQAKFPNIDAETTTVQYIIRGLKARPQIAPHIPTLLLQQHDNILQLRTTVALLMSTIQSSASAPTIRTVQYRPSLWCAFHNRYGNHTTEQCRDKNKYEQYPQDQYNAYRNPTFSNRGRGGYRGRRRGRGRGSSQYSNASGQPYSEQFASPSISQDSNQYNSAHTVQDSDSFQNKSEDDFSSYTIDSACYPTYTKSRLPNQKPYAMPITLADGSTAHTGAQGPITVQTTNQSRFKLPHASYAPKFHSNLLSVHELTTANNCYMVLGPKGGYILSEFEPDPPAVLATIQKRGNSYTIPLKQNSSRVNRQQFSCSDVNQRSIHNYMQKTKPRASPRTVPKPTVKTATSRLLLIGRRRQAQPAPTVRNKKTDNITHTAPFPYHLPTVPPHQKQQLDALHSWHLRMNHTSPRTIQAMARLPYRIGLSSYLSRTVLPIHCRGCAEGQMTRGKHGQTTVRPPPGHTVVSDIMGPLPAAHHKQQYIITFTEVHTRMTVIHLLKSRSETERFMIETISKIERHFNSPVSRIRTDNANEYLTKTLTRTLGHRGIQIDPTVPHTPQENSIAERLNRTLMTRVRSTLASMRLPFDTYWPWCALDTAIKYNHTIHSTINDIPKRLWEKNRSQYSPFPRGTVDVTKFRMFGEYGFVPVLQNPKKKPAQRGLLVRYLFAPDEHHYQVIDPTTGQLFRCRRANFMPYNPHYDPERLIRPFYPPPERQLRRVNLHHAIPSSALQAQRTVRFSTTLNSSTSPEEPTAAPVLPLNKTGSTQRKPTAAKMVIRPPRGLKSARRSAVAPKWKAAYEKEQRTHEQFGTFKYISRTKIPGGTPIHKAVLKFSYKYTREGTVKGYKVRFSFPGNRLEPWLHYNPHELSVYSADRDTVRLMLAIAAEEKLTIKHIDLKSAFLHEPYEGPPLYMEPLPQFDGSPRRPGAVALIQRNIYGLQNAPRKFVDGLQQHLQKHGYEPSPAEQNLYHRTTPNGSLYMTTTIDDFVVCTNSSKLYRELLGALREKYQAKDLGNASHLLGWSIYQDASTKTVHVSQPHLSREFIQIMNMQNAAPSSTPYSCGLSLDTAQTQDTKLNEEQFPYSSAIGTLRYLVDSTRPDLAFIVGQLARASKNPTVRHWKHLKQVARYIKGTVQHGLLYTKSHNQLHAQSDSDFAGCTNTRQSTHGYLIYYGNSLISWTSRRIKTVVQSTFAAEYIAASNAAQHIKWLRTVLATLSKTPQGASRLAMDNKAALKCTNGSAPTKKSKYIDIRYHLIKQYVKDNIIKPFYLKSKELAADLLTKALPSDLFLKHRDTLKVTQVPQRLPTAIVHHKAT